jgi:hypothetical protein
VIARLAVYFSSIFSRSIRYLSTRRSHQRLLFYRIGSRPLLKAESKRKAFGFGVCGVLRVDFSAPLPLASKTFFFYRPLVANSFGVARLFVFPSVLSFVVLVEFASYPLRLQALPRRAGHVRENIFYHLDC